MFCIKLQKINGKEDDIRDNLQIRYRPRNKGIGQELMDLIIGHEEVKEGGCK